MVKQLVVALSEIQPKGFSTDIYLQNILCETSPECLCIRIIDFGPGAFRTEAIYTTQQGADLYINLEGFLHHP